MQLKESPFFLLLSSSFSNKCLKNKYYILSIQWNSLVTEKCRMNLSLQSLRRAHWGKKQLFHRRANTSMVPASSSEVTSQKNKSASERVTEERRKKSRTKEGRSDADARKWSCTRRQTNKWKQECVWTAWWPLTPELWHRPDRRVPAVGEWLAANRAGWVCASVFVWVRKWSVPLRRKADSALVVCVSCMIINFQCAEETRSWCSHWQPFSSWVVLHGLKFARHLLNCTPSFAFKYMLMIRWYI